MGKVLHLLPPEEFDPIEARLLSVLEILTDHLEDCDDDTVLFNYYSVFEAVDIAHDLYCQARYPETVITKEERVKRFRSCNPVD